MASGISTETEIKLVGVARASLEELLEDYRDFLRTHNLPQWDKDAPRITQIRQLAKQKNKTYETYKSYFSAENPELFCNTMISLIHQTNYLLDRQIKSLEKNFTEKGGIRERMSRARKSYRVQQTEEALSLLREVYRELAKQDNQELMQKFEKAAKLLKERG
jgi:four helix bundle suffix protein